VVTAVLLALGVWIGVALISCGIGLIPSVIGESLQPHDLRQLSSVGALRRAMWMGLVVVIATGLALGLVRGADAYIAPIGFMALLVIAGLGFIMGAPILRDAGANLAARWSAALVVVVVGLVGVVALAWAFERAGVSRVGIHGQGLGQRSFYLTSLTPMGVTPRLGAFASVAGLIAVMVVADLALRSLSRRRSVNSGLAFWIVAAGFLLVTAAVLAVPDLRTLLGQGLVATALLVVVVLAYLIDYWQTPTEGQADASTASYAAAPAVILAPWGFAIIVVVLVVVIVGSIRRSRLELLDKPAQFLVMTVGPPLLWAGALAVLDTARGVGIL
jgi:hypothetical protein